MKYLVLILLVFVACDFTNTDETADDPQLRYLDYSSIYYESPMRFNILITDYLTFDLDYSSNEEQTFIFKNGTSSFTTNIKRRDSIFDVKIGSYKQEYSLKTNISGEYFIYPIFNDTFTVSHSSRVQFNTDDLGTKLLLQIKHCPATEISNKISQTDSSIDIEVTECHGLKLSKDNTVIDLDFSSVDIYNQVGMLGFELAGLNCPEVEEGYKGEILYADEEKVLRIGSLSDSENFYSFNTYEDYQEKIMACFINQGISKDNAQIITYHSPYRDMINILSDD